MREIKFRAWDKELKVMLYGLPYMSLVSKGYDELAEIEQKRYILMQYTGLKDKNGKEIYEGDIIKSFLFGGNEFIDVVEYYQCSFIVSRDVTILNHISGSHIEVIGNIYENPELIKE